jgi:transposase-like protein
MEARVLANSKTYQLCVRWYLTYRLSYRDLVEMMAERGVVISHSTILRWVQRYVPEFERRWSRYARGVLVFAKASSRSARAVRTSFLLSSTHGHAR